MDKYDFISCAWVRLCMAVLAFGGLCLAQAPATRPDVLGELQRTEDRTFKQIEPYRAAVEAEITTLLGYAPGVPFDSIDRVNKLSRILACAFEQGPPDVVARGAGKLEQLEDLVVRREALIAAQHAASSLEAAKAGLAEAEKELEYKRGINAVQKDIARCEKRVGQWRNELERHSGYWLSCKLGEAPLGTQREPADKTRINLSQAPEIAWSMLLPTIGAANAGKATAATRLQLLVVEAEKRAMHYADYALQAAPENRPYYEKRAKEAKRLMELARAGDLAGVETLRAEWVQRWFRDLWREPPKKAEAVEAAVAEAATARTADADGRAAGLFQRQGRLVYAELDAVDADRLRRASQMLKPQVDPWLAPGAIPPDLAALQELCAQQGVLEQLLVAKTRRLDLLGQVRQQEADLAALKKDGASEDLLNSRAEDLDRLRHNATACARLLVCAPGGEAPRGIAQLEGATAMPVWTRGRSRTALAQDRAIQMRLLLGIEPNANDARTSQDDFAQHAVNCRRSKHLEAEAAHYAELALLCGKMQSVIAAQQGGGLEALKPVLAEIDNANEELLAKVSALYAAAGRQPAKQ